MKTFWIISDNDNAPINDEFHDYALALQRSKELVAHQRLTHFVVELKATVRHEVTVEEHE